MIWIAPSEKEIHTAALERRLWADTAERVSANRDFGFYLRDFRDAKDHWSANSGLKSREYSAPVLRLIFMRFDEVRFAAQRTRLQEQTSARPSRRSLGEGGSVHDPDAYHAEGTLHLSAESRFDYILSLPEAENVGAKVNAAIVAPGFRLIYKLHGQIQNLRRTRDLLLSGQVQLKPEAA